MARNQLFESASAHALALFGDEVEASKWINYARGQLGGLLARQTGPTSVFLKPAADVEIQIFTRPNKIVITAGAAIIRITHNNMAYPGSFFMPSSPLYTATPQSVLYTTPWTPEIFVAGLPTGAHFSGGRITGHYSASGVNLELLYDGGYWKGKGGVAMSWTYDYLTIPYVYATFFIGPRWGRIQLGSTALLKNKDAIRFAAYRTVTPEMIVRFPAAATCNRVILVVAETPSAEYRLQILGVVRDTLKTGQVSLLDLGGQSIVLPANSSADSRISGFNDNADSFAICSFDDPTLTEKVHVIKFSKDYSTAITTEEYSRVVQGSRYEYSDVVTNPDGNSAHREMVYSYTLVAGEPKIERLQAEGNLFTALRMKAIAYSANGYVSQDNPSSLENSGGASTFSATLDVIDISKPDTPSVLTEAILSTSDTSSVADRWNNPAFTYTNPITYKGVEVHGFSHKEKFIIGVNWETRDTYTQIATLPTNIGTVSQYAEKFLSVRCYNATTNAELASKTLAPQTSILEYNSGVFPLAAWTPPSSATGDVSTPIDASLNLGFMSMNHFGGSTGPGNEEIAGSNFAYNKNGIIWCLSVRAWAVPVAYNSEPYTVKAKFPLVLADIEVTPGRLDSHFYPDYNATLYTPVAVTQLAY